MNIFRANQKETYSSGRTVNLIIDAAVNKRDSLCSCSRIAGGPKPLPEGSAAPGGGLLGGPGGTRKGKQPGGGGYFSGDGRFSAQFPPDQEDYSGQIGQPDQDRQGGYSGQGGQPSQGRQGGHPSLSDQGQQTAGQFDQSGLSPPGGQFSAGGLRPGTLSWLLLVHLI